MSVSITSSDTRDIRTGVLNDLSETSQSRQQLTGNYPQGRSRAAADPGRPVASDELRQMLGIFVNPRDRAGLKNYSAASDSS